MKKRFLKKLLQCNYDYTSVKKFHRKQTFSEDELTKIEKKFCIRIITRAKILSRHYKRTINRYGMIIGPISIKYTDKYTGVMKRWDVRDVYVNKSTIDKAKEYNLI